MRSAQTISRSGAGDRLVTRRRPPRSGGPRLRAAGVLLGAATVLAAAAGCNLLDRTPAGSSVIGSYVASVQVPDDRAATVEAVDQQLEAGSAKGPALQLDAATTVVNGGSVAQTISSATEFSVIRIAVERLALPADPDPQPSTDATAATQTPLPAATSTGAPGRGYHEVTLSAPTTEATIVLTIPQELPEQEFLLYFAAADPAGVQGVPRTQSVRALPVGTGDVQVSVSWNVDSDLDLHVIDPAGDEVFFGSTRVASGGSLDLDSNADCILDHVRNENITWATGTAPAGTYEVRVSLWDSCDVTPTHYVVTIQLAGQPARTITGTIDGDGDRGMGEGVAVTTFEVPSN